MSEISDALMPTVVADRFVDPLAAQAIHDLERVPLLKSSPGIIYPFTKPSRYHGRSMEDPEGLILSQEPITDENGDVYTSFSIKGADASLPMISYYPIEPSGVRVNGMLDASTFERCQKVSKILRDAGVLTEWPLFHARPKAFPVDDEDIGLLKFKELLFNNYLDYQRSAKPKGKADPVSYAGEVGQGLLDMEFGVMYRATLSNVRLREMEFFDDAKKATHIKNAIKALQTRKPGYLGNIWWAIEKLDSSSSEDQETYIREVLPQIIGANLGRFHNTDSFHKYLHSGNWTLAAEIVDQDSIRNASVNPDDAEEITVLNTINEVYYSAMDTFRVISGRYRAISMSEAEDWLIRVTRAYLGVRFEGDNLSAMEQAILDSMMTIDIQLEDLGDPVITSLDESEQNEVCQGIFNILVRIDELYEGDEVIANSVEDLLTKIESILQPQVAAILDDNGFSIRPGWLDENRIVAQEARKHYFMMYQLVRDIQDAG